MDQRKLILYTTLISAAYLAQRLGDPNWVIVDCRHDLADPAAGERAYRESHIAGARFAHLDRDLSGTKTGSNGRHPLPRSEALQQIFGRLGIGDETQVVAYDASGGPFAARLWWLLRWLGHDAVAVLDGGWEAWFAAAYPVDSEKPAITWRQFRGAPRPNTVDAAFVQNHLGNASMCLIDARAADRFAGINETLDPVGGHIPGALNRFYGRNLTPEGRFRPARALRGEFEQLIGDRSPSAVVHQCGSGVTACHNLLAMEVAGFSGAKLYPGSWSEWCADTTRPVATGSQ